MNFLELAQKRRSIRKYTDERISDATVEEILKAGLLAPSSRAIYPVEFVVVREKGTLEQLARAKTSGAGMLSGADVAIVVVADASRSDVWIEDASLATIYMQLAATERGIGNCWVQCRGRVSQQKKSATSESFATKDSDAAENVSTDAFVKSLLGVPEEYRVEAILALGVPATSPEPRAIPEILPAKVHFESFPS